MKLSESLITIAGLPEVWKDYYSWRGHHDAIDHLASFSGIPVFRSWVNEELKKDTIKSVAAILGCTVHQLKLAWENHVCDYESCDTCFMTIIIDLDNIKMRGSA